MTHAPIAAPEYERALCGCVLFEATATRLEIEAFQITPADFTNRETRAIWQWITNRAETNQPIDLILCAQALDPEVPRATINSCLDVTGSHLYAGAYAAKIRAESDRRRLIEWHAEAGKAIDNAEAEPGMLADDMRRNLGEIRDRMPGATTACSMDDAAAHIRDEPPAPSALLADTFGPGDVVQINGGAKSRKSFMLIQFALCTATGWPFLGINVTAGPVVFLNMEIRPEHFRRRLWRIAQALGVDTATMKTLMIIHGRGRTAEVALADVRAACRRYKATVIILDPVYKLFPTGDENASTDAKELVATIDRLAEDTGAAVVYCHHAAKGSPGDRTAVDRGAGSGVLSRAFDASLSIMPHASEPDAFVTEWTMRNYAPREPAAVRWHDSLFEAAPDLEAEPETTRSRKAKGGGKLAPKLDPEIVLKATAFLARGPITVGDFKTRLREELFLGDHRVREVLEKVVQNPEIGRCRMPGLRGAYFIGPKLEIAKLENQ